MNSDLQFEDRASSSRSKHEGESSYTLCDRLSRTRDISQRQLPTDHDYAVPTREYQIDQSSLKLAPTAARPVLERRNKQRQQQKQPHKCAAVDGVTPYQGSFVDNMDSCGLLRKESGGGRGIRTPGTLSGTTVFKTAGINRSPIPPQDWGPTRLYFEWPRFDGLRRPWRWRSR